MRRLAVVTIAALLGACQPQAPDGAPAEAPADAPPEVAPGPDFSGDLNLVGAEPFWAVKIRADKVTLMRPDAPEVSAPNPGAKVEGETAIWETEKFGVTLTDAKDACSDGMSDLRYPFEAQVRFEGEVLKGCAAREGAMPRE